MAQKYLFISFLLTAILGMANAQAATDRQYWAYWDHADDWNRETISHQDWDKILKHYVVNKETGVNRFRYGELNRSDKKLLAGYIDKLSATDPRKFSRKEQQAYWLNLYNALTVKVISDHYPVKSFSEISSKHPSRDPLNTQLVRVTGQALSLNDIENRILRPIWKDHKVHFGLNCADMSCPGLLPVAFTGKNVKELLKNSGREFINHKNGVTLKNGRLTASSMFSQYKEDFARDDKALLKVFAHYADDRLALYLLGFQGKIDFVHDRSLNSF